MTKLKLREIDDDKPVRLTIELPAPLHRDLAAYGVVLGRGAGTEPVHPARLIVPMLQRFLASDRGFASARRQLAHDAADGTPGQRSS
jgi:hypothetical protein